MKKIYILVDDATFTSNQLDKKLVNLLNEMGIKYQAGLELDYKG